MNYKNLRDHKDKTDMHDNGNGHYLQKCPFCRSTEMFIDARNNRGMCHNRKCTVGKRWLSIGEIDAAIRKYL